MIEKHSFLYSFCNLLDITKRLTLKPFILHGIVNPFSLCIIFRVSIFHHFPLSLL